MRQVRIFTNKVSSVMLNPKKVEKYAELRASLETLPHVSPAQVETWVDLQQSIDSTRDYLIRAVPDAQFSIDEAQKILGQRTYTLVFFGGTGVGKSTLINGLLGRKLLPTGAVDSRRDDDRIEEELAVAAVEWLARTSLWIYDWGK